MTVADVVAACQARVDSVEARDEAVKTLVGQYRAEGMTYADATVRVAVEVQDALRRQGWTEDRIRSAGVSYGNVRVICERR